MVTSIGDYRLGVTGLEGTRNANRFISSSIVDNRDALEVLTQPVKHGGLIQISRAVSIDVAVPKEHCKLAERGTSFWMTRRAGVNHSITEPKNKTTMKTGISLSGDEQTYGA